MVLLPACTRCAPAPTGTGGAAIVATYASGKVTAEDLQREANRLPPALREKFDTPDGRRELASAMIDKRLLAGEAKKRGLADDPEVRRQVEDLEQRLSIQALLAAEEKQAGPPSPEELRAYYDTHQQELASPERARAARIQISVARGASETERTRARARAQALADRVRRGELFEKVAAQGEGPERTRGGDLGFVLMGGAKCTRLPKGSCPVGAPSLGVGGLARANLGKPVGPPPGRWLVKHHAGAGIPPQLCGDDPSGCARGGCAPGLQEVLQVLRLVPGIPMTGFKALQNPILGPPARADQIAGAEVDLGFPVPRACADLLRQANGLRDDAGCVLYAASEIAERNRTFQVERYAPDHLAIGDNGGGRMVLIRRTGEDSRVYSSDMGDMDPKGFAVVGADLEGWLDSGCPFFLDDPVGEYLGELIDVYLVRMPANGLKGLSEIRQAMHLAIPLGDLKRQAESLPVLLARGQPRVAHRKLTASLGGAADALEERPAEPKD